MNLLKNCIVFIAAILLFASCQYRQKPQPEVYHPPEKKSIIQQDTLKVKSDTIQRDSLCIVAVGDIMLGTSYPDDKTLPPDSAKGSFKNVVKELRNADVTFGNLEGTLLDTGAPANYRLHQLRPPYLFRMPVNFAGVLKDAGFNVLSLANNHIGDFDNAGRLSTMKVLDSLGIKHGGQVSRPAAVFKINGVTYGFCAFAPNGYTLSILDLKNAGRIIRKLKQKCDVLIVSFHGGGEGLAYEHVPDSTEVYINEKRGNVKAFAHAAVDAGADLVFGNGPHVCRGMERYKDRLIAYSLGNFCTYKCVSVAGICGLAPILKVYVNKTGEFLSGRIISAKQDHLTGLEPDPLNKAAIRIKQLTAVDFPASGLNISDEGLVTKLN
ncbi:CapA family protein [Mucilaginibacter xinganensis]|uniref:Capsule synthesis protein CapA n=1 Tax=Mucilaginibacter xinganensis TaxID=1234841 RepID=A0A223NRM9_9SPHI|nr:CapA family protein [Mucilaginibacter xinganensis]ASU32410.1 capsule synthesis protein CapA [Mucilaginibacter xinganensis]